KLRPAGNVDVSFNITSIPNTAGPVGVVRALPSGKFVVSTSNAFYGFNPDGSPDPTFLAPANLGVSQITDWAFDSAGRIVYLGAVEGIMARFDPSVGIAESFTLRQGVAGSATAIA